MPTYRDSTGGTWATGSTSVTINKPTGAVEGDIILVDVNILNNSAFTMTAPDASWTQVDFFRQATKSQASYLWWKVCGASEPASWTFTTSSTSVYGTYISVAYSGCDTTTPIHKHDLSFDTTSQATYTTNSVTTTTDGCKILGIFSTDDTADRSPMTNGTGFTSRITQKNAAQAVTMYLEDEDQASAGAVTAAATYNSSPAQGSFRQIVALAPAATSTFVPHVYQYGS